MSKTTGVIISTMKLWMIKINKKPIRTHALDGAAFPYIVKVKYTVDGKEYVKRKFVGSYSTCPKEGNSVTVNYQDDMPSKCKLDL
jgi:hypothetical protein